MNLKRNQRKGFTLVEIMIASAIMVMTISLALSGFIMNLRALETGSHALVLQREVDEIINLNMAPEVRALQTVLSASVNELVFQYVDNNDELVTKAFFYQNEELYFVNSVPSFQSEEESDEYFNNLNEETPQVEVLGRFLQDVKFSFRDGGNNLLPTTNDFVDDPTGIEIIDLQITLGKKKQVYQVTNSFIPIRLFL